MPSGSTGSHTASTRQLSWGIITLFLAVLLFDITTASVTPGNSLKQDFRIPSTLWSRQTQKPPLSTNGRCGDNTKEGKGQRCPANSEEQGIIDGGGPGGDVRRLEMKCCSELGYCGGTAAHCGEFLIRVGRVGPSR